MKKLLFFLISLLLGSILFILVLNFVGWQEIKNTIFVLSGWKGGVIFCLTFLILLLRNLIWQEILKTKNIKISFFQLLKTYWAALSLRILVPVLTISDEIFQTMVLKKKNSIPITKALASVISERILEMTVNLIFIVIGILFFISKVGLPIGKLPIIFGGTFLFLLIGTSFFYLKVFKKESLAKTFLKFFNQKIDSQPLETEKEIFESFNFRKIRTWKLMGLAFLKSLIFYLRSWFLVVFLGEKIGWLTALSIFSFSYLATLFPIPAALGSHEAVQVFVFNSFQLKLSTATAYTMIIRGAELIMAISGGILLIHFGLSTVKNVIKNYEI